MESFKKYFDKKLNENKLNMSLDEYKTRVKKGLNNDKLFKDYDVYELIVKNFSDGIDPEKCIKEIKDINGINEKFDWFYWNEYQDGSKKFNDYEKLDDFIDKSIKMWNKESDEDSMLKIGSSEYKKVIDLAETFFNEDGWISDDVIHAMVAQV